MLVDMISCELFYNYFFYYLRNVDTIAGRQGKHLAVSMIFPAKNQPITFEKLPPIKIAFPSVTKTGYIPVSLSLPFDLKSNFFTAMISKHFPPQPFTAPHAKTGTMRTSLPYTKP